MEKDAKPKEKPKKTDRRKIPGQLLFNDMKSYLAHTEETMGRLHIEALGKNKPK